MARNFNYFLCGLHTHFCTWSTNIDNDVHYLPVYKYFISSSQFENHPY